WLFVEERIEEKEEEGLRKPQIDPQVFKPSIPSSVEPSSPDPKS
ncbi:hypothetical protein ISN45_Aa05g007660, partial [Arabidopsis thaliana x Arabidopsis arenosa]